VATIGERIFSRQVTAPLKRPPAACRSTSRPRKWASAADARHGPAGAERAVSKRVRGQIVTPGYLSNPEVNRGIFDEEGFYRTGDTAQLHDPADIQKGLRPLVACRGSKPARIVGCGGKLRRVSRLSPLLADVVVCGENLSS
jgi:acyl-CoA synthetase (AMP-forming)/AMP-acid ligase II